MVIGERRAESGERRAARRASNLQSPISNPQSLISNLQPLLLLALPLLYLLTLARSLVLGDPTEYTLVANVLGIAHPPGYAFITLAGKLFQTLIPLGDIPWRMHLLSATSATVAAIFIYGMIRAVAWREPDRFPAGWAALFGALSVGLATDVWQHAIHANPHIITATFLMANLYLLTRWGLSHAGDAGKLTDEGDDRWLYIFALSAGLGITHHPLTVFGFPAYGLFILTVRPGIWRQGRTIVRTLLMALLGLSVWLYFPLRSAMEPVFGPHNMNTLQGFLDHVLARGLTESLPFYSLAEQPLRTLVFWTLMRLQYALPTILLAPLGLLWLWRAGPLRRRLALLYGVAFLANYAFVICLRAKDIMAYLLGPFMLWGMLSGLGLLAVVHAAPSWILSSRWTQSGRWAQSTARVAALLVAVFFLLGPVQQAARNLPHISLRDYDEGRGYVEAVFDYFEGRAERAVLLHDWEHMTPMWYERFVNERWPDPTDVRPEFVSTQQPWVESVYAYLGGGPVYLNGYRSEIVAAGFRLRPRGPFYEVVEPGEESIPPELDELAVSAGEIEVVGYGLPRREVTAGDFVPLVLAMRAPQTPEEYYVPSLALGGVPSGGDKQAIEYTYTTDHHLLTPLWEPEEVIVERFDFALPHDLPAGSYPLSLALKNLSQDELLPLDVELGPLEVRAQPRPPHTDELLANFRQRVGLSMAWAQSGLSLRRGPWQTPLTVQNGDTINLFLQWRSLAQAEESYTVFVHLIDAANRSYQELDYTPLGGAAPTHLWIPKWLPGQRLWDPYRLTIRDDLPPGDYFIEVGLYEMTSGRRLHLADAQGNLVGDRYILGPVVVRE